MLSTMDCQIILVMKAILKGEGFMIIYDKELLFFQQNSGIVYDNSVWEKNQNLRGGKLGILWVGNFSTISVDLFCDSIHKPLRLTLSTSIWAICKVIIVNFIHPIHFLVSDLRLLENTQTLQKLWTMELAEIFQCSYLSSVKVKKKQMQATIIILRSWTIISVMDIWNKIKHFIIKNNIIFLYLTGVICIGHCFLLILSNK